MQKLFIIHGWTYTLIKWDKFLELIKAAGFEPVMLKVPGLTEAIDKPLALDDYVEWLNDKLKDEDKPIVVGHSNGGRIALAFEAKYPGHLGKLILIDSAGIYHKEPKIKFKRALFGVLAKVGKKITSNETLRKVLYKMAGEADYQNAPLHTRQTMANLITTDLTESLSKISTPTLIIWGRQDKTTPLQDGELMHALIQSSQIYIIDDGRHSPQYTHPEQVCEKIINFIQQNGF